MSIKKINYGVVSDGKPGWIIHYVANGAVCAKGGEVEKGFLQYACNAHSHGLKKLYGHSDFQVVLELDVKETARIINTLGKAVRDGEKFAAGDFVEGIYENCLIRLDAAQECGRKVLRVVVPDKDNRFPEDKDCHYPFTLQALPTEALYREDNKHCS